MGQFFQGAEATFIDDAMYKMPYELVGTVIDKKDKKIQEDIDTTVSLLDALKAQAMQVDEPALQNIIKGYEKRVEDIVTGIRSDVLNSDRFLEQTRKLGREITQDWSTGDVSKIQGNREAYIQNVKMIREAAKANPENFRHGQEEALIQKAYNDYLGYKDATTGEYRTYQSQNLAGTAPISEHVEKAIKGAFGEFEEIETDNETGGLRIKINDKWQGFLPQDLADIFSNYIKSNPNIETALAQREVLGLSSRDEELQAGLDFMVSKYSKRKIKEARSTTLSEKGRMDYAQKLKEQENASKAILGMSEFFDTTGNTNKDVYEEQPVLDKNGKPLVDENGKPLTKPVKLTPIQIWNKTVREHKENWGQTYATTKQTLKELALMISPQFAAQIDNIINTHNYSRGNFAAFTSLFEAIANKKDIPEVNKQQMLNQVENLRMSLVNSALDADILKSKEEAFIAARNAELKAAGKAQIKTVAEDKEGFNKWLNSTPAIQGWGLNNVNMKRSASLAGLTKEEQKDLNNVGQQYLELFSFSVDQFKDVKLTTSKGDAVNLSAIAIDGKLTFRDLVKAGVIVPSTKPVTEMEEVVNSFTGEPAFTKMSYNVFINGKPVQVTTADFLPLDRKNNKGEDVLGTGLTLGPGNQIVATIPVSQLSNSKIQDMLQKTASEREYIFRLNSWPTEAKLIKKLDGRTYKVGRDEIIDITLGEGPSAPRYSTTEGVGKEIGMLLLYGNR
jgi:hypothetical protein